MAVPDLVSVLTLRPLASALLALSLVTVVCSSDDPSSVTTVGSDALAPSASSTTTAPVGATIRGDDVLGRVGDVTILGAELNRFFDIPITLNEDTRALLWRMVAGTALNAAHEERFGAGIPEEAVDARFAELLAAMKEVGQTPSDFLEGANEEMIRFFASINALESETIARLSAEPAYVESLIEERIHLTTVCVRHILMPSSEALATVVARFEAGEDFAALASEASLDTTTLGGDLGCGLAYRYVSLFAIAVLEAPIGEIESPVVTQFGFHALIVDQRSAPGDDEVRANPLAYVPEDTGRSLWVDFFNDALLGADIELPSHVGSFTLESIEPPREGG